MHELEVFFGAKPCGLRERRLTLLSGQTAVVELLDMLKTRLHDPTDPRHPTVRSWRRGGLSTPLKLALILTSYHPMTRSTAANYLTDKERRTDRNLTVADNRLTSNSI
jgi:hypothetical protein